MPNLTEVIVPYNKLFVVQTENGYLVYIAGQKVLVEEDWKKSRKAFMVSPGRKITVYKTKFDSEDNPRKKEMTLIYTGGARFHVMKKRASLL